MAKPPLIEYSYVRTINEIRIVNSKRQISKIKPDCRQAGKFQFSKKSRKKKLNYFTDLLNLTSCLLSFVFYLLFVFCILGFGIWDLIIKNKVTVIKIHGFNQNLRK